MHNALLYGAARSMLNHALALREHGVEFAVLLPQHGPLEEVLEAQGIPRYVFPLEHFGLKKAPLQKGGPGKLARAAASRWRFFRGASRAMEELGRPIVHLHSTFCGHAALAARAARCPILWHVREERHRSVEKRAPSPRLWVSQLWVEMRRRNARRWADRVVYVSHAVQKKYGLPEKRSDVVYNFIRMPSEPPPRPAGGPLRVLHAGRVTIEKGAEEFLAICRAASRRGVDLVATYAGEGPAPYVEDYRRRIREDGLEDRLLLPGYVTDMAPLYAASDVLLFPSHTEALPRAVMEAMAYGRPVIASDAGGIPEMIESGRTGFIFDLHHPEAAVDALEALARDPARRAEMGRLARERARRLFSQESYVEQMLRIYREMEAARG